MRLTILGCQGPYPEAGGACSAYLVEAGGKRVLMEAGSGCLARLGGMMALEALDAVVLSHLHFDHMGEMPLLGYALQGCGKRLPVYLPDQPGPVYGLLTGFGCFQCQPVKPGSTARLGALMMRFLPARHPVPAVGVMLEADGKRLCYTGDTNQFPGMEEVYRGADLLMIDGGLAAGAWSEDKPHLSAALAAKVAMEAGPQRALLTHFAPGMRAALLQEAQAVYPQMQGVEALGSYEL